MSYIMIKQWVSCEYYNKIKIKTLT